MTVDECPLCDLKFPVNSKPEWMLHAFTHMIEYNREILHNHNTKEGYLLSFIEECRRAKLNDKEIEKIRPQAEYLIEVNLKK